METELQLKDSEANKLEMSNFESINEISSSLFSKEGQFKNIVFTKMEIPFFDKRYLVKIGIDRTNRKIHIISIYNAFVDDSILPETLRILLWVRKNIIKILDLTLLDYFDSRKNEKNDGDTGYLQYIVAPSIDRGLSSILQSHNLTVQLLEIRKWSAHYKNYITIDHINKAAASGFLNEIMDVLPKPIIAPSYSFRQYESRFTQDRNQKPIPRIVNHKKSSNKSISIEYCSLSKKSKKFCLNNGLTNTSLLVKYIKQNTDFLRKAGLELNLYVELMNFCQIIDPDIVLNNRFNSETSPDQSTFYPDDFYQNIQTLSVRSRNVLINSAIKSSIELFTYYKNFGTFIGLRNCGIKSNKELIRFCLKLNQPKDILDPNNKIALKESSRKKQIDIVVGNWRILQLSNFKFIVIGETLKIKDELKKAGGRFYPNIKLSGERNCGWVFKVKDYKRIKQILEEIQNSIL